MRILDRYILKSIILTFVATTLVFCLLYILIDSASNLDEFINRKVPLPILVEYYLANIPIILVETSSITCLIAILFTFMGLNANNEVIVLRSSGMNFWQVTKPALFFAMIICAIVFFLNERYIPLADATARRIKNENLTLEVDQKKKKSKITNLTFYGLKNRLYFIRAFDPNTYELEEITIIGYDQAMNRKDKIIALSGEWTGLAWKLFQCRITTYAQAPGETTKVRFYGEKLLDIKETPEDFIKQRLNIKSMNMRDLREYIDRFSNSGASGALHSLKVDLHQKMVLPLRCMIIVIVGLPLGLMTQARRGSPLISIAIAVLLGFLYYTCEAVGLALGKGGLFEPAVSAWLTPFIFTSGAFYLIKTRF
jgi:lipopolysaccharide export system permease protein